MHPNDSSQVYPCTQFPSPKGKHRNHVTVSTMTVPQSVSCPVTLPGETFLSQNQNPVPLGVKWDLI